MYTPKVVPHGICLQDPHVSVGVVIVNQVSAMKFT